MNDFTKDELHEIKKCIEWFDNNRVINFHAQLCNKIQSMIENYCEHDWRKGVHLFNDIYCAKCKKHFEVNN